MKLGCLQRLCTDLRKIGIEGVVRESNTYRIININGMDFYFYLEPKEDTGMEYDGWGTGQQDIIKDLGFGDKPMTSEGK